MYSNGECAHALAGINSILYYKVINIMYYYLQLLSST